MQCPKCQFENREGAKFCIECGNKLEINCSKCSHLNPPESKYCEECGSQLDLLSEQSPKDLSFDEKLTKIQKYLPKGLTEKILSQRDRIEGERKQVTVMFCDMVGFTPLSELLGIEDAYSIIDQVYEILIHKVHDYEGTVNEMTGDGIMALFGAPVALEDAPQRAIRSSLAIHREMSKFNDQLKHEKKDIPPIKMRIGIHSGPVVVGTVGNDLRVEFKAVGDTVNLASRVECLADPGATYVTEDTFKLTEGFFRFEALGEKKIKGKEKPVNVYRAIAPSNRKTRFDVSAERGLTLFVGRERELELLIDGYERAKDGRGQAFSIMADAGMGKSRLLFEFRKVLANEDVTFLEGRCLSYIRGVAYYPVIDILKSNFDIQEGDGNWEIKEKVKKGLELIRADEAFTLPYLLELLAVKDSGIDLVSMGPEIKKERILAALRRIVLQGSQLRPIVLAVEDLHWIDKSSEGSLQDLLVNISGARVLLIFTYRPEYLLTWGARSYHSQLNLNRLSNRESLMMVSNFLGSEKLESTLETFILTKTEGVPFFIEEFVRSLKDLDIIEKKGDTYFSQKVLQDVTIPTTVQDVIMARVDSLPEEAKEMLQIGSAVGREFDYSLITEVTNISETELLSQLSVLKDSELLYERGIYPQSSYIFKHALIREAVYESLLKSTRQRYHQKIACAFEKNFPQMAESQPEILAHHFTQSGQIEKAIPYWQTAGEIATKRSANLEAVDYLNRALALLNSLPNTSERASLELPLQVALGGPLIAAKGYAAQDVEQVYARALELCRQVGETSQVFPALRGLWNYYLDRGMLPDALEIAKQLLGFAEDLQDSALHLVAHRTMGTTLFFLGEFPSALKYLEGGISFYDPQKHNFLAFSYGADPGLVCMLYKAWTLWHLGYPDQALNTAKEALFLIEELSHPHGLAFGLCYASAVHHYRREAQAVMEMAEKAIALSTEQGFPQWLALGFLFRGWALVQLGQVERGIAQLHQGLQAWKTSGQGLESRIFCWLADAYGKAGQIDEGLENLSNGLASVNERGGCDGEAELYRLRGVLLIQKAEAEKQKEKIEAEAEACFCKALETSRRQQAKSFELRATLSLSRLMKNQGRSEEARGLLSETYGWFTEGFDTLDLKEAKTLLEELS
jgi:class 3 adenylate cyclase/predicted ATPase